MTLHRNRKAYFCIVRQFDQRLDCGVDIQDMYGVTAYREHIEKDDADVQGLYYGLLAEVFFILVNEFE
jgi:hypothetical protein